LGAEELDLASAIWAGLLRHRNDRYGSVAMTSRASAAKFSGRRRARPI